MGKFMAKRRHFTRTLRGLGDESLGSTDIILPEETFDVSLPEEEVPGGQVWNSVRSEKIRRARVLVQDHDYPPSEVLQSVAGLLAQHLSNEP